MANVTQQRVFQAPQAAVYQTIVDFAKYPEFLPEVVSAKVLSQEKTGTALVSFEIEVMKRFQYTLEFHFKELTEISWTLKESNFFKLNQGKWSLAPLPDDKTQVTYQLELTMGFFVPSWVTKKLTEVNLPTMFEQYEKRAQLLASPEKGK